MRIPASREIPNSLAPATLAGQARGVEVSGPFSLPPHGETPYAASEHLNGKECPRRLDAGGVSCAAVGVNGPSGLIGTQARALPVAVAARKDFFVEGSFSLDDHRSGVQSGERFLFDQG